MSTDSSGNTRRCVSVICVCRVPKGLFSKYLTNMKFFPFEQHKRLNRPVVRSASTRPGVPRSITGVHLEGQRFPSAADWTLQTQFKDCKPIKISKMLLMNEQHNQLIYLLLQTAVSFLCLSSKPHTVVQVSCISSSMSQWPFKLEGSSNMAEKCRFASSWLLLKVLGLGLGEAWGHLLQ